VKEEGVTQGMPRIVTDIDATEVVLMLAPETNGHVACKAWEALGKQTGRDHVHLALHREDEKIRFRDIQAQPRKIISSPTWSAWRAKRSATTPATPTCTSTSHGAPSPAASSSTRTTRGCATSAKGLCSYRPPVHLKTLHEVEGKKPNGNKEIRSTSSRRTRSGASTARTATT
jgi:nitrate reductase alpha subunit